MADRPVSAVSIDSLDRSESANVPLTAGAAWPLHQPHLPFLEVNNSAASESPRESYVQATPYDSGTALPVTKAEYYEDYAPPPLPKAKRRPLFLVLVGLFVFIVVVLAVILPVYFTVIKPHNSAASLSSGKNSTGGGGSGGGTTHTPPASTDAITGGDGSTVKASDGSTFTYNNKLGGICEFLILFRPRGYEGVTMVRCVRHWGLFAMLSAMFPQETARKLFTSQRTSFF